jgi:transposase
MSGDPDAVVDHRPDRCACCGDARHEDLPTEIVSVSERIELPKVAPTVTQHRRLAVHCPTCGMRVVARRRRHAGRPSAHGCMPWRRI